MSYDDDPSREVDPYQATWSPLVMAAEAGIQLSPADLRALQTREACLRIADYVDAVGGSTINTDDVLAHASALSQYYDGYATLRQFGVQAHAQSERPVEDYRDPAVMAEYVAGKWMSVADQPAQPLRQIKRQIEEITEHEAEARPATVRTVSTQDLTPDVESWVVMLEFVHRTDKFLAGDLGRPQLPAVEISDDHAVTN